VADSHLTKTCSECALVKPLSEFPGRVSAVNGVFYRARTCRKCVAAIRRKRYAENPEYKAIVRACNERQKAKNIDAHRAAIMAWYYANPEKQREYRKRYRTQNAEGNREHQRKYRQANKGKVNAWTAERWAAKQRAIPVWANRSSIRAFYQDAQRRAEETGDVWHVDHVVPLRSPKVCGLHVETNLQVVRWRDNKVKGNRYWPDMWEPE
jgi:hypothetical protein